MLEVAVLIGSYLLGSLPFGLIICKACRGIDIREYGSGNIGATNVLRSVGPGLAALVFAADIVKGFIPVLAAGQLLPGSAWLAVGSGMLAIVGHSLSVFLRFRGGKGAATSLGVLVALDPRIAGIGFGIWLLVVAALRYVSIASILTAASVPVMMHAFDAPLPHRLFTLLAAVFVIAKHRSNMARLIRGEEPRIGQKVNVREG